MVICATGRAYMNTMQVSDQFLTQGRWRF